MTEECERAWPLVADGARELAIDITHQQREQLTAYCRLVHQASGHTNLTALRIPEQMMRGLILDSLALIPVLWPLAKPAGGQVRLADVGTGAGVPGVPLKIMFPAWHALLIDSTGKKASFVSRAVETLGLANTVVLARRAEDVASMPAWRDRSDIVVARAVAPLASLIELCAPLARPGGRLVLPKGEEADAEIEAAAAARRALKLELEKVEHIPATLGLGEHRVAVVMRKTAPTPPGYPRRTGLAQSRPLGTL